MFHPARGIQGTCILEPLKANFPFSRKLGVECGLGVNSSQMAMHLVSGVPPDHLIDEATELQIGQLMSLSFNA